MKKEKLLLHVCCAPCLTSVLEKLEQDYEVSIFWFNPNIEPKEEHDLRLSELNSYLKNINFPFSKLFICQEDYQQLNFSWRQKTERYFAEPEGGKRCQICFFDRLSKTATFAKDYGYNIFSTTLTVSPWKNSNDIISYGREIAKNYGLQFLDQDFKKNYGYLRSLELSKKFKIYRQKYCGCRFLSQ